MLNYDFIHEMQQNYAQIDAMRDAKWFSSTANCALFITKQL